MNGVRLHLASLDEAKWSLTPFIFYRYGATKAKKKPIVKIATDTP
ncbi:hypothetical protein DSM104443_03833 [Usitatibacter rugosus]|uniref:Uncharacterized protein n=1 Tax=Usitatibacter rugosus TaxID=2732067 RepID=A0A6M4GZQ7_9PROT|nr:hypothetical protein DSM104443_03833 [Usitatibacter rugosus]